MYKQLVHFDILLPYRVMLDCVLLREFGSGSGRVLPPFVEVIGDYTSTAPK